VPEQYSTGAGRTEAGGRSHPAGSPIRGATAREIAASIERAVAQGALRAGDGLPSVRSLAAELGVSPSTVSAAVAELRRRGLVISRPRSGLQVAERPPVAGPGLGLLIPKGVRDLAHGNPDPAFLPPLARAMGRAAGPPRLYGEDAVVPELADVASAALRDDGIDATHLCVVNGALDGIERVLAAHLVAGDLLAVEDPGYAGVLDLARALGLGLQPVALDEAGPRPESLRAAIAAGARAVVLPPRGQTPTGAAIDGRRARELAAVLDRAPDVLVVEDDHLGPVAGVKPQTLTGGRRRWAAVRSTSKWLGPDLRLAVLAADPATVARVAGRQALGPGWVSSIAQRAAAALWADDDTAAMVEQATTVYNGRRKRLVEALAAHGIAARGRSGLNVYVPVADEDAAVRSLLAAGWGVGAGTRHRLTSEPAIRITISTLRPEEADRLAADVAAAVRPAGRTRAA
jgi:DNA-binding transcriptional MocR family regulator